MKIAVRRIGTALRWGLAIGAVVALSCRSEKAPAPSPSPAAAQAPDPGGPAAPSARATDVGPAPAQGQGPEAEGPTRPDGAGVGPAALDKDRLWGCYQEVYCAQKKGEMDRILEIYRKCGFQNPQDFTSAWIEAAKDTEWVSRLAHEVSKACK